MIPTTPGERWAERKTKAHFEGNDVLPMSSTFYKASLVHGYEIGEASIQAIVNAAEAVCASGECQNLSGTSISMVAVPPLRMQVLRQVLATYRRKRAK